jgi:hypothetical protein
LTNVLSFGEVLIFFYKINQEMKAKEKGRIGQSVINKRNDKRVLNHKTQPMNLSIFSKFVHNNLRHSLLSSLFLSHPLSL